MAIRATLKDLIDAGLLRPGQELRSEPRRGEVYTAQLAANGSIQFDGRSFESPSDWARHVAGNSRNGWRDVSANGMPLVEFRSKLPTRRPTRRLVAAKSTPNQIEAAQPDKQPTRMEATVEIVASLDTTDDIEQQLLARILNLSPEMFENLVGEFLTAKGLDDLRITQRSHDGGIDGDGTLSFLEIKVAFQAKRYRSQSIGVEAVAAFKGRIGQYDRGIFITTSTFTAGAREIAAQSPSQVVLLDGG